MAADIDEFIRNQKIRMARQKKGIPPAMPPQPLARQDHVGAILREDEPHPEDAVVQRPSNEERKAAIDGRYGGSAIPGLGERGEDRARLAASERHRDYNSYRAAAEGRGGYASRRAAPPGAGMSPAPGMVPPAMPPPSVVTQRQQPKTLGQRYPQPPPSYPAPAQFGGRHDHGNHQSSGKAPELDRKLEHLEKTVAELREQMTRQQQNHRQQQQQPEPPVEPRPGWSTPDYAELLAAKRRQEAMRRRLEDPELFARQNVNAERERQLEELDFDLTARKNLLMTRRHTPRRAAVGFDDEEAWMRSAAGPADLDQKLAKLEQEPAATSRPIPARRSEEKKAAQRTGLSVGLEERGSAKARRQGAYREQLQQQIREQQEAKKREKAERLSVPQEGPQSQRGPASQRGPPSSKIPTSAAAGLEDFSPLTAYNTPADDAYFYYASRDPLDAGAESGDSPPAAAVPRPTAVPRAAVANRARQRQPPGGAPGLEGDDSKEAERRKKEQYAQELQRQMAEVAAAKERRRKEQEEYDRKKDEEIASYHLFQSRGGGGGEPIKLDGQVVTDLRAHNRQGGATPRAPEPSKPAASARVEFKLHLEDGPGLRSSSVTEPPMTDRTPRQQVNAHGEVTFARGGHGVFGQPRTDEEKQKIDHYKEDLRRQIEENQRKKEEQKRREKIEEEKEQKRAEEQLKRIQAELDEEQRKKQEKIDATKRKNEEMWKEAEEKRKRDAEQRKKVTAPVAATPKETQRPPPSPPVPSVNRQRRTLTSAASNSARPPSGPTPNARRESHPDVLRQLEKMKKELQTERIKVEDALKMPPPLPPAPRYEAIPGSALGGRRSRASEVDVFELARQGRSGPVVGGPRPKPEAPSQELLREFRNLKLRESEVGQGVRMEHPATPLTSVQLEVQQNTYLRQQEDFLHDMAHRPIQSVRHQSPRSPAGLPQPRSREPERDPELASTYSFDVDEVNQRSEERMRRLFRMNPDQVSMQDQDEVLDRFMRERKHVTNEAERQAERPPSMRNRQFSYRPPVPKPHGDSESSRDLSALAGINVNSRDGWEEDSAPGPGRPTPLDDSWLNPTRHR